MDRHWVVELVEAGVLEPRGPAPEAWAFPASALVRARAIARLVNDLGVNLAGAAVILDLIEERTRLERRLDGSRAADVDYVLNELRASERRTQSWMGETRQSLRYVALAANPAVSQR